MLPSSNGYDPNAGTHLRVRLAALIVVLVAVVGASVEIIAGAWSPVPPAPPAPATASPTITPPFSAPPDWYIPPTPATSPSQRPGVSIPPGSPSPTNPVSLPPSLGLTATDGSRYGDTWSFEPVLPAGYTLDTGVTCRWIMALSDGRSVSTAGPATAGFCGAWRVTVPYVPPSDAPSDYPAVVTLRMSGANAAGQQVEIISTPYKALPLDGGLSTSFTSSNLPLLWLDGSPTFDADGKAQLRLHWLSTNGALDGLTTTPAGLQITEITPQIYQVASGIAEADAVIDVAGHDPATIGNTLSARFTITKPAP